MTIVVWANDVLATDMQASDGDAKWQSEKAWYSGIGYDRIILSGTGPLKTILAMREWYKNGADPNLFPKEQLASPCHFLVVEPVTGLKRFETTPTPIEVGQQPCAFGEGRDIAHGALHMGASAKQAVEAANAFSVHCGLGVKEYHL